MGGSFKIEMTIRTSFEGVKHFSLTEDIDDDGATVYIARRDDSQFIGYRSDDIPLTEEWRVKPATARELIAQLENAAVSPCPPFVAGVDGTTVAVKITRGFNSAEFTWWEDLPEQWEGLRIVTGFFKKPRPGDGHSN